MKSDINAQRAFLNASLALLIETYRQRRKPRLKTIITLMVHEIMETTEDIETYLDINGDAFGFDFVKMEFTDDV